MYSAISNCTSVNGHVNTFLLDEKTFMNRDLNQWVFNHTIICDNNWVKMIKDENPLVEQFLRNNENNLKNFNTELDRYYFNKI